VPTTTEPVYSHASVTEVVIRSRWWQAVSVVGIVAGIGFVILAVIEDLGLLVQAAIPFAGAVLTLRGRLAGAILIGAFCLLEVVFVPFYDRNTAIDWIAQVSAWTVGVIGLVAVAGLFREHRRLARARRARASR
jgi:hypothetical protein